MWVYRGGSLLIGKKADMGIGTLIIFIAMILVAAIAAGVLIQTATSLQNKALLAGDRTRGQVSTAAQALLVYAENGSTGSIDRFYAKIKLVPGSDPIKFEDSLITLGLQDASADLNVNMTNGTCADWEFATGTNGEGNYSVKYLITGNEHREGYMHRGDVALLCFESPRTVLPDENIDFRFTPKIGTTMSIETSVPDIVNQQRVYIFP